MMKIYNWLRLIGIYVGLVSVIVLSAGLMAGSLSCLLYLIDYPYFGQFYPYSYGYYGIFVFFGGAGVLFSAFGALLMGVFHLLKGSEARKFWNAVLWNGLLLSLGAVALFKWVGNTDELLIRLLGWPVVALGLFAPLLVSHSQAVKPRGGLQLDKIAALIGILILIFMSAVSRAHDLGL